MKKSFLLLSMLCCLLFSTSFAQSVDIFPKPQQISYQKGLLNLSKISLKGNYSPSDEATLAKFVAKSGTKVTYKLNKSFPSSEGYTLTIDKKGVRIEAGTPRGLYYGTQSLTQILNQGATQVPYLSIQDQPDVAFRGTVEGFYGKPWSQEDPYRPIEVLRRLEA